MASIRKPSIAAQALLAAFLAGPTNWRYGYDLTKETRVGAGTLYPLLDRWARQGLLESEWRNADAPGRPARHAYRLTSAGIVFARTWAMSPAVVANLKPSMA
jgi:DNA-binding PadR family transcriptional regulator